MIKTKKRKQKKKRKQLSKAELKKKREQDKIRRADPKHKAYMREYQLRWIRKNRADFFKDKKCKHCGSTEKMELHHKDPKKKESHKVWSWSKKRREKELKKCIVLCKDCHLEAHRKMRPKIKHGTTTKYRYGCRCAKCIEARKFAQRDYRARKRKALEKAL